MLDSSGEQRGLVPLRRKPITLDEWYASRARGDTSDSPVSKSTKIFGSLDASLVNVMTCHGSHREAPRTEAMSGAPVSATAPSSQLTIDVGVVLHGSITVRMEVDELFDLRCRCNEWCRKYVPAHPLRAGRCRE